MKNKAVKIRVPGTTANCGPGFDTLGMACTIYNDLEMTILPEAELRIEVFGAGAEHIPRDARNIVWRSARYLFEKAGCLKDFSGVHLRMTNQVPLSRGLGSSATAVVAGLKAANVLLDHRYHRRELLRFATEIEGHPDNVSAALFGGFTVNTVSRSGHVECFSFLPKLRMNLVGIVPNFHLATRTARSLLPTEVPLKDAVFNIGRTAMLVAALSRGNERFLRHCFEDVLHQPYRAQLIPGMYDVFKAAKRAGALGVVLSGAGPCLMAFTSEKDHIENAVAKAMLATFARYEVEAEILQLKIDTRGAHVLHH